MIPLVAPNFFQHMPKALSPLLHSGILLAAIVAVLLNLYFNSSVPAEQASAQAKQAAAHAKGS